MQFYSALKEIISITRMAQKTIRVQDDNVSMTLYGTSAEITKALISP